MADEEKCPKCGEPKVEGRLNCVKCGAVYSDGKGRDFERDHEEQGE